MALSRVTANTVAATSSGSTTPSATYAQATAAGNLLLAAFSWNQNAGNRTISSGPSGWSQVPGTYANKSSGCGHVLYYKVAAGTETSVTLTLSGSAPWRAVITEINDTLAGTWSFDKSSNDLDASKDLDTGSTATTSTAEEYWVALFTHKNTESYTNLTTGFSTVSEGNSGNSGSSAVRCLLAEFVSSSIGSARAQARISAGRAWTASIATFQSYVAPVNQTVEVDGVTSAAAIGAVDAYTTYPTEELPVFTLHMAVTSRPHDETYEWVDVTTYRRGLHWQRGRQNQLNRIEAGTGNTVVRDETRIFDSDNTDSDFYPYVLPVMPIRLTTMIGSNRYHCFEHFVEDWSRTRIGPNYAERSLPTVDAYELFALADLAGANFPEELSGARLNRVLDAIGWPASKRVIADGQTRVDALEVADDTAAKALQHIQDVVSAENGLAFIDGRGRFVFLDRYTQLGPPYSESKVTFNDTDTYIIVTDGAEGVSGNVNRFDHFHLAEPAGFLRGQSSTISFDYFTQGEPFLLVDDHTVGTSTLVQTEYKYQNIVPNYGTDLIFNDLKGSRANGGPQAAQDEASIEAYGRRSLSITSVADDDNEVEAQLQYKLAQFKDPLQRIAQVTVKPGANVELWKILLGLDIGDRITVKEHPPGGGPATIRDYSIQHLAVTIPPGPVVAAQFDFQLWPGETADFFIFDDEVKGRLDYNSLSY